MSNASTLETILSHCPKTGELPLDGDFLQLFEWSKNDCRTVKDIEAINRTVYFPGGRFYVHQEILCVLEASVGIGLSRAVRLAVYSDEKPRNRQEPRLGSAVLYDCRQVQAARCVDAHSHYWAQWSSYTLAASRQILRVGGRETYEWLFNAMKGSENHAYYWGTIFAYCSEPTRMQC